MKKTLYILAISLLIMPLQLTSQIPESEVSLTASSTLPPGKTSNYSPDNLMDGTIASWSEGADSDGVGEKIFIEFRYKDEMGSIVIYNGFGNEKYWKANARVKKLKITDQSGSSRTLSLPDKPGLIAYGLQEFLTTEYDETYLGKPLSGSYYELEIEEVYPGERWKDLCLTEIMINKWYTTDFPMTESYIYRSILANNTEGVLGPDAQFYFGSEWEGLYPYDVDAGYLAEEITSGDGTTGYKDFHVFIFGENEDFLLFESAYISSISQAGMEGLVDSTGKPDRINMYSWSLRIYNKEKDIFEELSLAEMENLFIQTPAGRVSAMTNNLVSNEDLHLSVEEPGILKLNYPAGAKEPELEIFYLWDGNWFREMPYSPDLP